MAGWIVYTNEAIYGTGWNRNAAKADAREHLDPDCDMETDPEVDWMPATPALIQQVHTDGGAIAWGEANGIACTTEEADAEAA